MKLHEDSLTALWAILTYEGAALAGGHHQPEGDGGPRHRARADQAVQVLTQCNSSLEWDIFRLSKDVISTKNSNHNCFMMSYLIKFVANKCKCLKNGFSVAGNSDDPLGTASITDVDLCTTLENI